jgi:hypothetical protein
MLKYEIKKFLIIYLYIIYIHWYKIIKNDII